MNRRNTLSHLYAVAVVWLPPLLQPAAGDPVLDPYANSLTSYLADPSIRQGIHPLVAQRGVNIDGSLRLGGSPPMSMAGNPFGEAWDGNTLLSGVRLDTGTVSITDVDLALPSPGFSWVIGRSYNVRQLNTAGNAYTDSNGYQGYNWFQLSQPEIVFYDNDDDPETTESTDMVYLIYGADRFIEFKRAGESSDQFKAVNGAAGVMQFNFVSQNPDYFIYTDQRGWTHFFYGFDGETNSFARGQYWKTVAPGPGTTTYKAEASGYGQLPLDSPGMLQAEDPAGRDYEYTYEDNRLIQVEVRSESEVVALIQYAYYSGTSDPNGLDGDLKLVTIKTPLTNVDSDDIDTEWLIRKKYYRYYKGTYDGNPQSETFNPGNDHHIKMILDFEGTRRFSWDADEDLDTDEFLESSVTDDALKHYASAYFEYEDDDFANGKHRRITKAWFNGSCGCSEAVNGIHEFSYACNGNCLSYGAAGYDTGWKTRTVAKRPNSVYQTSSAVQSWLTQYFDETGQPLGRVETNADPAQSPAIVLATQVVRDAMGCITAIHSPANISSYSHSTGTFNTDSNNGLITIFTRLTDTDDADLVGFLRHVKWKKGDSTSTSAENLSRSIFYVPSDDDNRAELTIVDVTVVRPMVSAITEYTTETTTADTGPGSTLPTGANRTTMTYDLYNDGSEGQPLDVESVETTFPAASTSHNGSGSATISKAYFDKAGRKTFEKTTEGKINFWQYRSSDGQLEKAIEDADTDDGNNFGSGCPQVPTGFTSCTDCTPFNVVTCYNYKGGGSGGASSVCACTAVSAEGNSVTTGQVGTDPTAVSYTARLNDGRIVTLGFPNWKDESADKYYGPVSYTVTNHAGKVETQGVVALSANGGLYTTTSYENFVDEFDANPVTAIDGIGTVAHMTTSHFDQTGQRLEESRQYFDIPNSNFDSTFYGYDAAGRLARIVDPTETIRRSVYDAAGRLTEQWLGTDDSGWGTSGSGDMVRTAALAYDANGNLTSQTLYLEGGGSPASRQTTYTNDVRGQTIVTVGPTAPYAVNKFDNLGRRTAVGFYSSSSGLGVGTDPTATSSSNRVALSETLFDDVGRAYRNVRWKIDPADGSKDDSLEANTWYDASGRVIKEDGSQLVKIVYDRLGRQTNQFVLADDNDTAYSHAAVVDGDHVLQEQQTVYESETSDNVLMTVVIDRFHDDLSGDEVLDSNSDNDPLKLSAGDVSGRPQITAYWYDILDRVTDTVAFGMYDTDSNGTFETFDRSSFINQGVDSAPARADDKLRTTYTYNPDGMLKEVTDPKGLVTRHVYDAAARQVAHIRNYVDGTPSGVNGDDDVHTRYVYTNGLQAEMWVDLDGDNVKDTNDQVTTYTYEVTTSDSPGASKLNANNLLRRIKYPDLESGETDPDDRQVLFAYNAQAQQIWTRDQADNQITTEYDAAGRLAHQRATNINTSAGFDNYVKRISTTYDALGRRRLVTQYDNDSTSSGAVRDEVAYSYDDWGNLALFEQDRNSAVGASGSVDDYEVSYTYAKATGGRNTVRRMTATIPSGAFIEYEYHSANGVLDDKASRVSQVRVAASPAIAVAKYFYNGPADVVGTDYPEPEIAWHKYGSTSGVYPDLDNFNRVTSSRWTRIVTPSGCTGGGQANPDFYNVGITYDRNSNVDLVVDNIHLSGTTHQFDADYVMEGLDRLRKTQEGHWTAGSPGSITTIKRQQLWEDNTGALALDQIGNWSRARLDLNGDGNFIVTGSKEYDDSRTHNLANELKTRDLDSNSGTSGNNYTLSYDKPGNLTDDGVRYTYVYDVFGRLRQVKGRTSPYSLVAEYRYNGLGHRIGWHYDVNLSGSVNGSDLWYYFAYDERWRIMATFRGEDDAETPRERFVYHNAGFDGLGGSSYIDAVILRDRDNTGGWGSSPPPSDGVLEERRYYFQNWRNDVVAIVTDAAKQVEQVRYSSYGVPFGLPVGDTDGDGDADSTDSAQITAWKNAGTYDVRGDLDFNGCVNATDVSLFRSGVTMGWSVLTKSDTLNRKGYAGYEFDPTLQASFSVYHVRRRVLNADLGRWMTRDPLRYVDGASLYQYVSSNPLGVMDPFGTDPPGGGFESGGQGRRPHIGPKKVACGPGNPYCSLEEGNGGDQCEAGYSPQNCEGRARGIDRLKKFIEQKRKEYNENLGPKGRGPLPDDADDCEGKEIWDSRELHRRKIVELEETLRKKIQDYNNSECGRRQPIPVPEFVPIPVPYPQPSPAPAPLPPTPRTFNPGGCIIGILVGGGVGTLVGNCVGGSCGAFIGGGAGTVVAPGVGTIGGAAAGGAAGAATGAVIFGCAGALAGGYYGGWYW